jgi:hypothetical protein
VIDDVDESLRAVIDDVLAGERVAVSFDPPQPGWAESVDEPTIDCFLHDIVEDQASRRGDSDDVRDGDGRVVARQPSARYFRFRYLVSAWADSYADEHRLLGRTLRGLCDYEHLPVEHLRGSLAEQGRLVTMQVGPPRTDGATQPHDLWSALGLALRTGLDLELRVPVLPTAITEIAPPAEQLHLDVQAPSAGITGGQEDPDRGDRHWTAFRVREPRVAPEPTGGVHRVP